MPKLVRGALVVTAVGWLGACQTPGVEGPPSLTAAEHVAVVENEDAAFAIGLVPTAAPPVMIGTPVTFRLSASAAGYAHLYLLNASGNVLVLAENLPLAAGRQVTYPLASDGITLRATPPAGIERTILVVTRQPLLGFAKEGGETLTRPVALPLKAETFVRQLNQATGALPVTAWAATETRVQIIEPR